MPQDFPIFGESLKTFHYSVKVSNLGKFGGIFLVKFDQNQWEKTWLFIFLALQMP
jgi:hypothetical protein